jgi:hypothetical protein
MFASTYNINVYVSNNTLIRDWRRLSTTTEEERTGRHSFDRLKNHVRNQAKRQAFGSASLESTISSIFASKKSPEAQGIYSKGFFSSLRTYDTSPRAPRLYGSVWGTREAGNLPMTRSAHSKVISATRTRHFHRGWSFKTSPMTARTATSRTSLVTGKRNTSNGLLSDWYALWRKGLFTQVTQAVRLLFVAKHVMHQLSFDFHFLHISRFFWTSTAVSTQQSPRNSSRSPTDNQRSITTSEWANQVPFRNDSMFYLSNPPKA